MGTISGDELVKAAQMGYHGEDYKKYVLEKEAKKWEKDEKNITAVMQMTGKTRKEAKEFMETLGRDCYKKEGITDIQDICAIEKLTKDGTSQDLAIAGRYYAKKRLPKDVDLMTEEQRKEYIARWAQEYKDEGYNDPDKLAETSFDMAIRFNKARSKLTKV